MKKIIALFLCIWVSWCYAQNIVLKYEDNVVNNNDTIYAEVANISGENFFFVDIYNESAGNVQLMVTKEVISMVDGGMVGFCIPGGCITGNQSFDPIQLHASSSLTFAESGNEAFHVTYTPDGAVGSTLVYFNLFDQVNSDISSGFYISMHSSIGITEHQLDLTDISAYPNPASNNVTIQYGINNQEVENAEIVIRNLVGNVVLRQPINTNVNKIELSVKELNAGIYFYSMEQNGRKLATKKLIVK